jgi:fused signal recognition particle receptor
MGIFSSFVAKLTRSKATPEEIADFKSALIEADLGLELSDEIVEVAKRVRSEDLQSAIKATLKSALLDIERSIVRKAELTTILVVGVNGTGKTTTVAKLASQLHQSGNKVIVAAADTFRAAAVDQLKTWADRIGIEVVTGKAKGDPASVAFDAAKIATEKGADYLIIDTAGRLHNKSNLMDELSKIAKVVSKITSIDETLFILDGTTGQNGIAQAEAFGAAVQITGLVVTKLDGSTKGGIALAVERALKVPVKFVGVGEGVGDLRVFDPDSYIDGLLTNS